MKLSVLIPVYNQEELVIKALDHLPRRNDVEVLVRDDGSTDNTLANLLAYHVEHPDLDLRIYSNGKNRGVAYTKNRLLEDACGEYIHLHDSDDYAATAAYDSLIDRLDGADVYVFNLIINSGAIYDITEENGNVFCAQIARFIRTEFVNGMEFPEAIRAGDDGYFAVELEKRNPKTVYTRIPAYYYNYPREGSLTDMRLKGILP